MLGSGFLQPDAQIRWGRLKVEEKHIFVAAKIIEKQNDFNIEMKMNYDFFINEISVKIFIIIKYFLFFFSLYTE